MTRSTERDLASCIHNVGAKPVLIQTMSHSRYAPREELFSRVGRACESHARTDGIDFAGPGKMLFSSDHPWVDPQAILKLVRGLRLPSDTESKVLSDNARLLFRL